MMARRNWADLSQEQRERLQRDGISQAEWEAGPSPLGDRPGDSPSGGHSFPPRDPPDDARGASGEFPDRDELEAAVNDPDGHADFWRGRGGGRISASAHDVLEDRALRNLERQVGESDKYNRNGLAERMEGMSANQLRILAAMNSDQMRRMADWANRVYRYTGSRTFTWLFYH